MPDSSNKHSDSHWTRSHTQSEVILGMLVQFDDRGAPLVDWPGNPTGQPIRALGTMAFTASDVGRTAALLFASGDPERPLIVGLVQEPIEAVIRATEHGDQLEADRPTKEGLSGKTAHAPYDIEVNDEQVTINADKQLVLRCGKASITLSRSGKISLRGTSILSRSSGTNRIKGGSVQMN